MSLFKSILKNLSVLFLGCLLVFIMLEVLLRFYNPFISRVEGNKIILSTNEEYVFENKNIKSLDATITYRTNALGFRGDNPPENFSDYLTLITIGSSTTEGSLISEGKTWTDLLGKRLSGAVDRVWINNAGFDGHSTFGHRVLMEDYIIRIKPRMVLFLIGGMDAGRNEIGGAEKEMLKDGFNEESFNMLKRKLKIRISKMKYIRLNTIREVIMALANKSEVFRVSLHLYRFFQAEMIGVTHSELDLYDHDTLELSEDYIKSKLEEVKFKSLPGYRERLIGLLRLCKENNIDPVLITFPLLVGDHKDEATNVDLSNVLLRSHVNGELGWKMVELYNEVSMEVGEDENILVIDLANKMPKNSSYYYDTAHFNNKGSAKVADIIYEDLCPYIEGNYSEYVVAACNP